MKIIKYVPKNTSAGTEYREIDPDDMAWIQSELVHWLILMGQKDQGLDDDSRWIRDNWWHKHSKKLHKGRTGLNTPCSVVSGILENMMYKIPAQRDFSDKQMEDIEMLSQAIHAIFPDTTPMRFQIGFSL
jgi:hypothetical protein